MYAIVGSGFGLYGYLPALAGVSDEPVLLPEAYRERFRARPELAHLAGRIRWMRDERSALEAASAVVIATPPARQVATARAALALPNVERLVLEKPLAPDPATAARLVDELLAGGKRFRAGYTFLHTAWARDLAWPRRDAAARVQVTWTFLAHHYANGLDNWKREAAQGGGALRFFGVHLLALLARAGYRDVARSAIHAGAPGEAQRWEATFIGPHLPDCDVLVDSRGERPVFRIAAQRPLVDLTDPYAAEQAPGEQDRRIGVLLGFLRSFEAPDEQHVALCREVNALWLAAETAAPR